MRIQKLSDYSVFKMEMAEMGGRVRPTRRWEDVVECDMRVMGLEKQMEMLGKLGEDEFMDRSAPASGENGQDKILFVCVCFNNKIFTLTFI